MNMLKCSYYTIFIVTGEQFDEFKKRSVASFLCALIMIAVIIPFSVIDISAEDSGVDEKPVYYDGVFGYS